MHALPPPPVTSPQQGISSADSIHVINHLTSGLFTVNAMWTYWNVLNKNVNNQSLTQVSQLYIHVSFCHLHLKKVNRSWLNLAYGGHVICMGARLHIDRWSNANYFGSQRGEMWWHTVVTHITYLHSENKTDNPGRSKIWAHCFICGEELLSGCQQYICVCMHHIPRMLKITAAFCYDAEARIY